MIRTVVSQTCQHRSVAADGRIICGVISSGDNEVSPNICRDCPVKAISCDHLRFSLQKVVSTPITVRYATGRVEVWDDQPPRIAFLRAACSERVSPIGSPRECAGCALHSARTSAVASAAIPEPAVMNRNKVIVFPRRVAAAS